MLGYIFLIFAMFGTAIGQILLKKHHDLEKKQISIYFLVAVGLFISVPIFIYLSLQYLNFIIVFLSDAIVISIVVFLSSIFLNEKINIKKIVGIVSIVLGIIILNWRMI